MKTDLFHGSSEVITEIRSDGVFCGIFASADERAALSHGHVLHRITSPRHLTDFELNYKIEGAWDIALELASGNEDIAEAMMSVDCKVPESCARSPEDAGELGWKIQRLRGELAARLGYTSVEMRDEHGTTHLCLPGCSIEVIEDAAGQHVSLPPGRA